MRSTVWPFRRRRSWTSFWAEVWRRDPHRAGASIRAGVAGDEHEACWRGANLIVVRPGHQLQSQLLATWLQHPRVQESALLEMLPHRRGTPGFTATQLAALGVALPPEDWQAELSGDRRVGRSPLSPSVRARAALLRRDAVGGSGVRRLQSRWGGAANERLAAPGWPNDWTGCCRPVFGRIAVRRPPRSGWRDPGADDPLPDRRGPMGRFGRGRARMSSDVDALEHQVFDLAKRVEQQIPALAAVLTEVSAGQSPSSRSQRSCFDPGGPKPSGGDPGASIRSLSPTGSILRSRRSPPHVCRPSADPARRPWPG